MRPLVAVMAVGLCACGGGDGGGANTGPSPADVTVSGDFQLECTPDSFEGVACASAVCTLATRGGFASDVVLRCEGAPDGVSCGFGSNPVSTTGGSPRVGVTISVDPNRHAGEARLRVLASGGGLERAVELRLVSPGAGLRPSGDGMLLYGCAGYRPSVLGPDDPQAFRSVFVGAWREAGNVGFCRQTLGAADGSFAFEVPRGCVSEGADLHLTAGGLTTCTTIPFQRGGAAFVALLGQRANAPCP